MQRTEYTNATEHVELRRPKHKRREYFFLQNLSGNAIYYSEDTLATAENGIQIASGEFIELDLRSGGVPQGSVWILGTEIAPTRQRVLIKEE